MKSVEHLISPQNNRSNTPVASKKEFTQEGKVGYLHISGTANSELCFQWAIFPQSASIPKSLTFKFSPEDGQYVDTHFMGNYFLGFLFFFLMYWSSFTVHSDFNFKNKSENYVNRTIGKYYMLL